MEKLEFTKIEIPTELEYVIKRNFQLDPSTGEERMPRTEKPRVLHIEHNQFLNRSLEILEEKTVDLDIQKALEIPTSHDDIIELNPSKRIELRDELAQTLITYSTLAVSAFKGEEPKERIAIYEQLAAEEISPYRYDPQLLHEAAERASQVRFHIKEKDYPTALDYVTRRNYWLDQEDEEGNRLIDVTTPPLLDRDHHKFLDATLKRINPDGTVDMGHRWKPTEPVQTEDILRVGAVERGLRLDILANELFVNAEAAATVHYDPEGLAAFHEGLAAQEVARYRDNPDFLQEAAAQAEKAYKEGKPFVIDERRGEIIRPGQPGQIKLASPEEQALLPQIKHLSATIIEEIR